MTTKCNNQTNITPEQLEKIESYLENFSIAKLLKVAFEAYHRKGSLFNIVTPKIKK